MIQKRRKPCRMLSLVENIEVIGNEKKSSRFLKRQVDGR
jgi:hypothetical protein